ncbi:MAG: hypothetical protein H0T68_08260, partial [Gemmatimonadales bacterium]|nr:hypothetical protein [Gemmatimonadales bacterium]
MMRFGRSMAVAAALLGAGSGVGVVPALAQEHERTTEVAKDLVAPESQHEANENQIDIVHHIGNAHEVEIPFFGVYELPRFPPIHLGNLAIDLSPTKHLVFMLLAAVLVTIVFLVSARGVTRAQAGGRPAKGFAGAMEATALYIRQEVILPNVGHHGEGFV